MLVSQLRKTPFTARGNGRGAESGITSVQSTQAGATDASAGSRQLRRSLTERALRALRPSCCAKLPVSNQTRPWSKYGSSRRRRNSVRVRNALVTELKHLARLDFVHVSLFGAKGMKAKALHIAGLCTPPARGRRSLRSTRSLEGVPLIYIYIYIYVYI